MLSPTPKSILLLTLIATLLISPSLYAENAPQEDPAAAYKRMLLAKGQWVFEKRCVFCHEKQGKGQIGPNLTDNYYIYGNRRQDLERVIRKGLLPKGMPVWEEILDRSELRAVAEYAWSLQGLNLKGKEPQGVDPQGRPPQHNPNADSQSAE